MNAEQFNIVGQVQRCELSRAVPDAQDKWRCRAGNPVMRRQVRRQQSGG